VSLLDDEEERAREAETNGLAGAHPAAMGLPPSRDYSPDLQPSAPAAPVGTDITRDHLGNPDPASGSAMGPDYAGEDYSGPGPVDMEAETFGVATDADPTLPGEFHATDSDPVLPGRFRGDAGHASPSAIASRRGRSQRFADESAYDAAATRRDADLASGAIARADYSGPQTPAPREAALAGLDAASMAGPPPGSSAGGPDDEVFGMATDADPVLPGSFRDDAPGDPMDAETHGMAADGDPTFPGTMAPEGREATTAIDETSPELVGLEQSDARGEKPGADAPLRPEDRLDYGLPDEDQTANDIADPFRHILHALGAGLTGALGRSPPAYVNQGDANRQARAEGMRERLGLKAEDRADAADAEQEAAQAAQAASVAERGLGLRERVTAAAERTADSTAAAREASTAHTQLTDRQTAEQRAAMERADSSESQSARRAWQAGVERLP